MAHFAQLDETNTVLNVIVVADEDTADADGNEIDAIGEAFCADLLGGTWRRTSYNNNYRVRFAMIGSTFDEARDAFIDAQPFPSWVLNDDTTEWEAPVPRPDGYYVWGEDTTSWIEVTE